MSGEDLAKQNFFTALDCLDRGDLANADRYFRATLKIVPAHGPSLANLAAVLVHQGHFEEGRERAEQAVAVGPPSADVLNTRSASRWGGSAAIRKRLRSLTMR